MSFTTGYRFGGGSGGGGTAVAIPSGLVTKTASFTPALVEAGQQIDYNSSSVGIATIPNYSTVAFPVMTQLVLRAVDASLTIQPAAGVTFSYPVGTSLTLGRGQVVTLIQTSQNNWEIIARNRPAFYPYHFEAVNLNSVDDTLLTTVPRGYTVSSLIVSKASSSLSGSSAAIGLFTGASGTGTNIVSSLTLTGLTSNGNLSPLAIANLTPYFLNQSSLYLRVTTAHGSTMTANIDIILQDLSA